MTDAAIQPRVGAVASPARPTLDSGFDPRQAFVFFGPLGAGLLYVAFSLYSDVSASGARTTTFLPNPRPAVTEYVAHHKINEGTYPSLAVLVRAIDQQVKEYGSLSKVTAAAMGNIRNEMYLASEALRLLVKDKAADLSANDISAFNRYKQSLDNSTKFIPTWVKVAVAIALGLGTMIGWKRIVVTVGERIGKTNLTYGQGATAELVAAGTIAATDMSGFRCRQPTSCPPASPARWRPTARGCKSQQSATSRSSGC